jgi:transcriptional regulator with XRE-family HTH domain
MERDIRLNWQSIVKEAVKRRKEQRLTQEELAIMAGISKPTLNRFEQGDITISIGNAIKILHILSLD